MQTLLEIGRRVVGRVVVSLDLVADRLDEVLAAGNGRSHDGERVPVVTQEDREHGRDLVVDRRRKLQDQSALRHLQWDSEMRNFASLQWHEFQLLLRSDRAKFFDRARAGPSGKFTEPGL